MNYHPDDVELWLIDCKKVEFGLFLRMRPQHVRMVSLERSREFAFAFFDYLLDFAKERTQRMLRAGVSDLRDYRRYNQNLLLCGRDPAMAADIVLSAVLSARMCGVRVTVLAEAVSFLSGGAPESSADGGVYDARGCARPHRHGRQIRTIPPCRA